MTENEENRQRGDPLGRPTALMRPPVMTGCEAEIRRVKPKTLEELKEVVSEFVASLDEEEMRRYVRDVRPRARCAPNGCWPF